MLTSRRKVLLAISQVVAVTSLTACGGEPTSSSEAEVAAAAVDNDVQLLAGVAYDLLPFDDLDPALYVQVAQRVLAMDSPTVKQGLAMLRENMGSGSWLEADESVRLDLLGLLERSAFFTTMRATTIEVLYRDPAVFELVGYGGSAIEKGGYINRGFADISWLPEGQ